MKVKVTYVGTKILDVPDENFEQCPKSNLNGGYSNFIMSSIFTNEEDINNTNLANDWSESDEPAVDEFIMCIEEVETDKTIYEY